MEVKIDHNEIVHLADDRKEYDIRVDVESKHFLTVTRPEDAIWIIAKLGERLIDKTVVEIGAGVGVFAMQAAAIAKHVYAIEADPAWSWTFVRDLYQKKPRNLTWILDCAENLVGIIRADLAIVITGSAEDYLRELASEFAEDVCMPWQDWNDNKAKIPAHAYDACV